MSDLGALVYLETRMLVNRIRQIVRKPLRLILWSLFVLWFGLFIFIRSTGGGGGYALLFPAEFRLFYAFVPALYFILLGAQIVIGCRRPPASFAYPADARFLFGSRLPPRLVVFWLQLREAFFSGSRLFFILFVTSWSFANSAAALGVAAIALAAAYIIAFGLRLPAFLAARRLSRVLVPSIGVAMIAAGVIVLAYPIAVSIAAGDVHVRAIAAQTLQFPPGTWLTAALGGQLLPLFLLSLLAAVVVAVGSLAASDAYPELWEASVRLYQIRALAASGRALWNREAWRQLRESDPDRISREPKTALSVSGQRTPEGALTIAWKEWLALRRSPGGLRWPLLWLMGSAVLGYLAGIAALDYSLLMLIAPVVAIANTIVVIGSQSMITLSTEIRRPLWWLSHGELQNRLLVWAAAGLLRVAPPIIVVLLSAGITMRSTLLVIGAVPLTLALLLLIRAIGLACYVILPGRNDMRGPGFILRMLATYVLVLPPALAWTIVQTLSRNLIFAGLSGLVFAAVETWALIYFAGCLLQENAMSYATAEER